jgi:hypothetical protein
MASTALSAGSTVAHTALRPAIACDLELSSSRADLDASAHTLQVDVVAPAGCAWEASSSVAWLSIVRGAQGVGNGTVEIRVGRKAAATGRYAQVQIGPSSWFTISQAGGADVLSGKSWDFDRDSRADLTLWRPSTGEWLVRRSSAPSAAPVVRTWGEPGDVPVPGDYDGDQVADLAVWRPSTGVWRILESSAQYAQSFEVVLGGADDVPVPADYDGDGRRDVAVWRPIDGLWQIRTSGTGYAETLTLQWGTSGDQPITGDFDGDGRADLALWRPATGTLSVRLSHLEYAPSHVLERQITIARPGDVPVIGDFDGDGASDFALWRPSTGAWQLVMSEADFQESGDRVLTMTNPTPGDEPMAADYDGDGRADLALWRPSAGALLVESSVMGFARTASITFAGAVPGDLPVTK